MVTERMQALMELKLRTLWRSFVAQGPAFWGINVYLIVEYVRPQQLIPGLSSIPLGNISLVFTLMAAIFSGARLVPNRAATWLLVIYGGVVLLSSAFAFRPAISVAAWKEYFIWVVVYLLIAAVVTTEERFFLFIGAWLLHNFYMSQGTAKQFAFRGFRFAPWGVTGAPGWFMNSGELGIEMCMFVPISWHFYQAVKPHVKERWKKGVILLMPLTAVVGAVGSSSRGALLGLAGVAAYELLRGGGKRLRAAVTAVVLVGLVYIMLPEEQKQRFRESGEDTTSVRRLNYWKKGIEMTRMYPVLGIGYANWVEYYKDKYRVLTFEYVQVSHNIFIQCMSELGLSGLTVFVCLILANFVINARTRKLARAGPEPNEFILHMGYSLDGALVGYLLSGFFVTVLYYPYFWINLSLSVALNQVAQRRKVELRRMTPAARSALAPQPVPATAARTLPRRSRR